MKQRYLLWLILCAPFLLTWCFDILDWEWMVNEGKEYPVAEQVCIDNGWEVTTDNEWTPICLLWDRWINLADMEEHPENNNETDEEVIVEETIIEQE